MKTKDLAKMGVPYGRAMRASRDFIAEYVLRRGDRALIGQLIQEVIDAPQSFIEDEKRGKFARAMVKSLATMRKAPAPWKQWGSDLDENAVEQLDRSCQLPISVKGALMPDAHVGYGLPIGGVLATENAVIPYAVGVDIACRMKMSVLDMPLKELDRKRDKLMKAIDRETRFGIGARFEDARDHEVMDQDWKVSPVTRQFKDRAWSQLGTSGSGNHFVEFGKFTAHEEINGLPAGDYLALLSHSGSRGTGANVCAHYSKLATEMNPDLKREFRRLAWLGLDTAEGQEYWAAMELMGHYAAANHAVIHQHIAKHLRVNVALDIENHHNFAWKETHAIEGEARELIVHRKGATPADKGVLGIIPGSMATPGFVVRGKGNAESLNSAAHGAGRVMSRKRAIESYSKKDLEYRVKKSGITLMSAGLDEAPMVYKDIHRVMAAQKDLVEVIGQFDPRIVKMAPAGERAED